MSTTSAKGKSPKLPQVHASKPVHVQFPNTRVLQGAGVAIFHVRTKRVVICFLPQEGYWFLPKGRKDQGETIERAAEREGFEESGYRNRLLPLPLATLQTQPRGHVPHFPRNVTDPVWIEIIPQSSKIQYILHWFIAETVPPDLEKEISDAEMGERTASTHLDDEDKGGLKGYYKSSNPWPYQAPSPYPRNLTLKDRVALEQDYEPIKHPDTGMDGEEALYESYLLPIEDAIEKLSFPVHQNVVLMGWTAIERRQEIERKATEEGKSEFLFYDPNSHTTT